MSLLFFFLNIFQNVQLELYIKDATTKLAIEGVSVYSEEFMNVSDVNGKVLLEYNDKNKEAVCSHLSYEKVKIDLRLLKSGDIVYLNPASKTLLDKKIKPINPLEIIATAFLKSDINHLPSISFYQKCILQERFYEHGQCIKYAESAIDLHQFKKSKASEKRPYYIYGSAPEIKYKKQINDSSFFEFAIKNVGKRWTKGIYDELSVLGYVKGINQLNTHFTNAFDVNSKNQLLYKGKDTLNGTEVYHIDNEMYTDGVHFMTTSWWIHTESYAVVQIESKANDNIGKINLFDFQTKAIMWALGIKLRLHKLYNKLVFVQIQNKKWIVKSNVYFLPMDVKYKKIFYSGYVIGSYKIDTNIIPTSIQVNKDKINDQNELYKPINTYNFNGSVEKNYPVISLSSAISKDIDHIKKANERFLKINK